MANPNENRQFRHYLDFRSDDTGRIEITEPVKFDASVFVIEQDDKGYARDVSFMAEEISLEFYDVLGETTDTPYYFPNGVLQTRLSHCLPILLEYDKRFGFQSEVAYILERNGLEFETGELNFEGRETDEETYFFCKIVQNTKRALAKRREDIKIDGFASEDLDGNPIPPLVTTNMLLKAKPVTEISQWKKTVFYAFTGSSVDGADKILFQNPISQIVKYGINDTLSGGLQRFAITTSVGELPESQLKNMVFIDAQNDLTDGVLKIENLKLSYFIATGGTFTDNGTTVSGQIIPQYRMYFGNDDDITSLGGQNETLPYTVEFIGNESLSRFTGIGISGNADRYDLTFENIEVPLSNIPNGLSMYASFYMDRYNTLVEWLDGEIKIDYISTAIDSVVKTSRYIDLLKQSLASTNGMELVAPRFDEGGEFYDLFAFSGNLVRQRDDVPFYFTLKDRVENLMVVNSDLQINDDNAFALQYQDYYSNIENGVLSAIPSNTFKKATNSTYAVNSIEFEFSNYEKDKDEENTLDTVHTKAQFSINNDKVSGVLDVKIKDTFDPKAIEVQRREGVKETTALEGDNKIYVVDGVPLAPATRGGFTSSITSFVNSEGNLQLLKTTTMPAWSLLGFNVGADFNILSGQNTGSYLVDEIEDGIVTLSPSPTIPTYDGVSLIEVDYPLQNVQWTNRTNEGFDLIENLDSPLGFGNLKYTIRRCLVHFEPMLSTASKYITDDIKNTEFINNGELITQFEGGETYQEDGDIVLSEIQDAILSANSYTIDVKAPYDEVLAIIKKYQVLETVGGFLRVMGSNSKIKLLYPKKLEYNWATELLTVTGEEREDNDFVTVRRESGTIYINEVGYDEDFISEAFYQASGDYFVLIDINNVNLINFTKYDRFIVQEETFEDPIDLAQALIDL